MALAALTKPRNGTLGDFPLFTPFSSNSLSVPEILLVQGAVLSCARGE